MAQFPFRKPVNTEDSPEENPQELPDYFKPASADTSAETSKMPDWFTPVGTRPLSEHDKAKKDVTFLGSLKQSAKFTEDELKDSKLGHFLEGVTSIPKSMYNSVRQTGKTGAEQIMHGDVKGAFDTITNSLMGPINTVNKMLEDVATGQNVNLPSKSEAKHEMASQVAGMAGLPWDEVLDAYKHGNYSKLAGMGLSAVAIGGLAHFAGSERAPEIREPVKPDITRPFGPSAKTDALRDTTPQQDAVAIAQTRDAIPRTAPNISTETGIPKPSVRRTISELKKKTSQAQPEVPEVPKTEASNTAKSLDEFIKQNPTAKMSEIEQFMNSMDSIKYPTEESKVEEPKAKEPPIQQAKPFVNPFEKSSITDEKGNAVAPAQETPTETPLKAPGTEFQAPTVEETKAVSDIPIRRDILKDFTGETYNPELLDKATERLGMGKPNPELVAKEAKLPDYFKPAEEPAKAVDTGIKDEIKTEETKKPYTIENAPPNQRAKMQRGAHEPVDILFSSPEDREIFGSGQSIFKGGVIKSGIIDRIKQASERIATKFNMPLDEARKNIIDYNAEVRKLGSAVDKEGGNITAPSFEEFIKSKSPSIVEMQGGLGGFKPSKRALDPTSGPYSNALDKLFNSMGTIQEKRLQQDQLNRIERARRFSEFSKVNDVGAKGAAQSLSKLKGEFDKVDLDKLKMTQPQVDSLFTAVKRANITPGEKARGYTALFKIFNGELPQRNELGLLDDVFGNNFSSRIVELHGGIGAIGLNISKAANTMKTMQNMLSLAAPLRHGIGMIARKEFYPAFADMFKFFGNKEYYDAAMQAIENHPKYLESRENGLFIPKQASGADEEFLDSYIGNLPKFTGIPMAAEASKRAYTGFLNKLKFDVYDNMTDRAKDLGYKTIEKEAVTDKNGKPVLDEDGRPRISMAPTPTGRAIARFINTFTGRGDLGPLNKVTRELNLLLWSPRMIASRLQMFTSPKLYTELPKEMRIDGLKSLLAIAALGTAIDTAAAYGGAKVSTNILSTDFGKSRFGTHLIDPWGGFEQYVVAAARFLAGKTDSNLPTNRLNIGGRFLANKESPAASLAHTMLTSRFTGKSDDPKTAGNLTTEYGQKSSVQKEVMMRYMPIFAQDLQELSDSDPEWSDSIGLKAALTGASLAGMAQDYPEKGKNKIFKKMSLK